MPVVEVSRRAPLKDVGCCRSLPLLLICHAESRHPTGSRRSAGLVEGSLSFSVPRRNRRRFFVCCSPCVLPPVCHAESRRPTGSRRSAGLVEASLSFAVSPFDSFLPSLER